MDSNRKEYKKKYVIENAEAISKYKKEYRQKNATAIKQSRSIFLDCGCGSRIKHYHKSEHFKTKKHKQYLDSEINSQHNTNENPRT